MKSTVQIMFGVTCKYVWNAKLTWLNLWAGDGTAVGAWAEALSVVMVTLGTDGAGVALNLKKQLLHTLFVPQIVEYYNSLDG